MDVDDEVGAVEHECNFPGCSFPSFSGGAECVLHAPKTSYDQDISRGDLLESFRTALIDYILEPGRLELSHREELKQHLLNGNTEQKLVGLLKSKNVAFLGVHFPARHDGGGFDYFPVLKTLHGVSFEACEFSTSCMDLGATLVRYEKCRFEENYVIGPCELLTTFSGCVYNDSIFQKRVIVGLNRGQIDEINPSLFHDCSFKGGLQIVDCRLNAPVFDNSASHNFDRNMRDLTINQCELMGRVSLNGMDFRSVVFARNRFLGKLEFKTNKARYLEIVDSNFDGLVDMFESDIGSLKIEKSIFSEFVGFERCVIGSGENPDSDEPRAVFRYATFLNFVNFRSSRFCFGLDIRDINAKEPPNFLGIQIEGDNTNRESFRIIKYSFDSVGNYVEANKFYAREMKAYERELADGKEYSERFVFAINRWISNYGQDYVWPLKLLIYLTIVNAILIYGLKQNWLYEISMPLNSAFSRVAGILNGFARGFTPLNRLMVPGMEFLSMVSAVLFSILIWQMIVAIKRHTRR